MSEANPQVKKEEESKSEQGQKPAAPAARAGAAANAITPSKLKAARAAEQVGKPEDSNKKIKVKSRVNMLAKDGTHMVKGESCELSAVEHARLSKDKRGPMFD